MAIFHSYVCLPEGKLPLFAGEIPPFFFPGGPAATAGLQHPGTLAVHEVNVAPSAAARATLRMASQAPGREIHEIFLEFEIDGTHGALHGYVYIVLYNDIYIYIFIYRLIDR